MQPKGTGYTVGFAAAVCVVCSIAVAGAAVSLKDRQEANKAADRQKKVLSVAGIISEGQKVSNEEADQLFNDNIVTRVVDLKTGAYADDAVDIGSYDQREAAKDPELSYEAGDNDAKIQRLPTYVVVYQVLDEGQQVDQVILPIQGPGLWSTLYGFIAVDSDGNTVKGITFYEHGETPGLGGEVDNANWKKGWIGRKVYDDSGEVALHVIKGKAAGPEEAPYEIDGLSGATLTSNGVSTTIEFWLGEQGFAPYLDNLRG